MNDMTNLNAETLDIGLHTSAILVDLTIRQWQGRKLDKRATQNVNIDAGAKQGMARVNKSLLGNNPELEAIRKHVTATRDNLALLTAAWDGTKRILRTDNADECVAMLDEARVHFNNLVGEFLDNYEYARADAELMLGHLYNPDDYPDKYDLANKFSFFWGVSPVPKQGDLRVDLSEQTKALVLEQFRQTQANDMTRAMEDVWTRVADVTGRMAERLTQVGGEKRKVFRDTLVSNITDLLSVLDGLNVTNDPTLASIANDMRRKMHGVTPNQLRHNDTLRTKLRADMVKANAAAKQAIDNLPGLGF